MKKILFILPLVFSIQVSIAIDCPTDKIFTGTKEKCAELGGSYEIKDVQNGENTKKVTTCTINGKQIEGDGSATEK